MSALREEAEREVLERHVDRTVRIVALGGDPGWADVNYSREVALDETTLRVEATFVPVSDDVTLVKFRRAAE